MVAVLLVKKWQKTWYCYYDKEMIGQIAEQAGLSSAYVRENAELSPKKGWFAYAFFLVVILRENQ